MIQRSDILSMEYLKKTEYTGGYQGMRYRLEGVMVKVEGKDEEEKQLKVTVWPEPFNYFTTPEEQKTVEFFSFDEDGVVDAIAWMNDRYFEGKKGFETASRNWTTYKLPDM